MVVETVQRERLVVQCKLNGGYADIVLRCGEANSQRVVAHTATHTADEIHQGGIAEVMLHGTIEVERALRGIASTVSHCVAGEFSLYKVLADGHRQFVVTVLVGLHGFTVLTLQHTIDIELYAVGGNIGAGIVDVSAHHE